ncbi:MAG: hypothetical protein KJ712_04040, partial [Bacteroidetes bacterium]|nr:hypothetical protein [Bacteroidota bacterium]
IKSKNDIINGYDKYIISQLTNLSLEQLRNIENYLKSKGLIELGKNKSDFNIYLTALGIDESEKQFENINGVTIKFLEHRYLQSDSRAVTRILFYYNVLNDTGIESQNSIVAIISDVLGMNWGFPLWSQTPEIDYKNLAKILLQFAKDKVVEKIKEGTLNAHEEIVLLTTTHPDICPYDNPDNLVDVKNAEFWVEIGHKNIGEEINENKLAASIIEIRDLINAIFYNKYKSKLLLLNNERNLLDFFKTAISEEEFSHRISSLGDVSRNFNIDILRKITQISDSQVKSLQLLDSFFIQNEKDSTKVTEILKHIGRIRQGYPIHSDNTGITKSLGFFKLPYPIVNYEQAWLLLLNQYLLVLKELYELLNELYLNED